MYWREKQTFPTFAKMAKKKRKSIPDTSGDVERLILIAGSMKKARSSKMIIMTIKNILLCREYRVTEIIRKKENMWSIFLLSRRRKKERGYINSVKCINNANIIEIVRFNIRVG